MLDEQDGKYYPDKVTQLEQEQVNFLKLLKKQSLLKVR
jgi:hypothetical protein